MLHFETIYILIIGRVKNLYSSFQFYGNTYNFRSIHMLYLFFIATREKKINITVMPRLTSDPANEFFG